jgi:hypothetical protein
VLFIFILKVKVWCLQQGVSPVASHPIFFLSPTIVELSPGLGSFAQEKNNFQRLPDYAVFTV